MTPEQQLRQRIQEQETALDAQKLELGALCQSALQSLQWKNILTHSVSALVQFQPLQQLLFTSTLRFAAFKMGKALLQKLWKMTGSKGSTS
ncbi:MAG: hypothetical protein Q8J69_07370 [Sphingobacteriaceae bacterium]|nr:hypothetical protein [Sphingobacteriaceae bacterium]